MVQNPTPAAVSASSAARFDFRRAITEPPPSLFHVLDRHRHRKFGATNGGRGGGGIGGSNSPPHPRLPLRGRVAKMEPLERRS
jgi:hypothetical protein